MTSLLCRHFGLNHIQIAEDIVSDAFLKASEYWSVHGVPPKPAAWLYMVARNKAKDYFRRKAVVENHHDRLISDRIVSEGVFELDNENISDGQLSMIFTVCNSAISPQNSICFALQVLYGFSVKEIANAFLGNTEMVKKKLQRVRANLRANIFKIKPLTDFEIQTCLNTVLKTIYLLFNEGYFSEINNNTIRKELCVEAVRLNFLLTENSLTNTPQTNALLALLCFQSSRLDARMDERGEIIFFNDQDKSKWDQSLIAQGNYYLINACVGNEVSKYHLEAGIAYWHTTELQNKWSRILDLYNQLTLLDGSPVIAVNRIFAFSQVYGQRKAIKELEDLNLIHCLYSLQLNAYLHSQLDPPKAIEYYDEAIQRTNSTAAKLSLRKQIERLLRTLK